MHLLARSRLWQAAAGLALLLVSFNFIQSAAAEVATAAPIPPGDARLWFYRVFFAGDIQDMPAVGLNGGLIGYALPGTSFYRDVPAGQYRINVASEGQDVNQAKTVALAPGEVVYAKIVSAPNWDEGGGPESDWRRGTYYVMLVPPRLAGLEMAQTRYGSGS